MKHAKTLCRCAFIAGSMLLSLQAYAVDLSQTLTTPTLLYTQDHAQFLLKVQLNTDGSGQYWDGDGPLAVNWTKTATGVNLVPKETSSTEGTILVEDGKSIKQVSTLTGI